MSYLASYLVLAFYYDEQEWPETFGPFPCLEDAAIFKAWAEEQGGRCSIVSSCSPGNARGLFSEMIAAMGRR